jgi:uncharacterized protein YegL
MTDPAYTHYVVLIDRTGSMQKIKDDTEGGVNAFIEDQRKVEGKATLSLYQFDSWHDIKDVSKRNMSQFSVHIETVADFLLLDQVKPYHLVPRGNTPLHDAVGMVVTETGEKLARLPEDKRPGQVIMVIATDGGENDSREWTKGQVKSLITQQTEKYGWKFTYIGANQDAFREGGGMGIPAAAVMDYAASSAGTRNAWNSMSANVAQTRQAGPGGQGVSYGSADRAAAKEE